MPVRLLAINALGLYAMLMYGITYYAITTAAPRMAAEFGYPGSSIFAILTVSLLMTAALAPRLGRLTDRIGASSILLGGALLRSALLAGMALSPEPVTFAIALLLVQILGQVTEYDATFAAAVELAGDRARSGMSQITLWGGLASTAFWPATAFLLEKMSWRAMFLVYAAVILGICAPIAAFIRSVADPGRTSRAPAVIVRADATGMAPSNHTLRSTPPFWLLAAAFALGGVTYNLPSLMLPVLDGLGLGASAVMAVDIPSSDADTLRGITDKFREKYPSGVIVVGSVLDERPLLIASVTDDLIKRGVNAGDIVRTISKEIDGSGGGRPNLAQAGGKKPAGLKKALALVLPLVKEKLG
jgi:MFS family permease